MSANQGPRNVYAIIAKDPFLRAEAVTQIMQKLDAESVGMGPVRFDGDHALLADVLDEVRTLSLLGGMRIAIVEDADDFITKYRAQLEGYCSDPATSGCLILLCDSMPRNTRLYKIINEHGEVVTCEPPKGRAVSTWISQRSQSTYGKQMREPAAARLREHLGDAPGVLDAELAKLSAYVGQRTEITADDVDRITGNHREETVFAVTDAIASGDVSAALHNWEQVLATDRGAPGKAIGGLAWAVRRLLEARRELDEGVNVRALAARLFTNPEELQRRLARVSTADLERQLADLLIADIAVKTGSSTIEPAIERFIARHAIEGKKKAPASR
jgi:DNA polymerase-3 subunit delta